MILQNDYAEMMVSMIGTFVLAFVITTCILFLVGLAKACVRDDQFPTDDEIHAASDEQICWWVKNLPAAETEYQLRQLAKIVDRYLDLPHVDEFLRNVKFDEENGQIL